MKQVTLLLRLAQLFLVEILFQVLMIYSASKNEKTSFNHVFSRIRVFQSGQSKREFFIENRGFRQTSDFPY